MDTAQYLGVFIDESTEHLDVLYKQLLELEKHPTDVAIIEEIFRAAHTLKGMSATMGYEDLANLTHKLENVFDGIRQENIQVNAQLVDVLFEAVDQLNMMVEDISSGGDGAQDIKTTLNLLEQIEQHDGIEVAGPSDEEINAQQTNDLQKINTLDEFELSILNESEVQGFTNYEITVNLREDSLLKGARAFMVFDILEKLGEVIKSEPPVQELEEEKFDHAFTVILISKYMSEDIKNKIMKVSEIDSVSVQHFSILDYKKEFNERTKSKPSDTESTLKKNNSPAPQRTVSKPTKTIRVNIDRLDVLMNLFEELLVDRGRLEQLSTELNHQELEQTVESMTRISNDLQDVVLSMRMVPIEQVFSRFPSMVRSLSRELHKQIDMEIVGAETELDRTVIDEIGDPLIHLLRNAIDHGIEAPEERRAAGKPEQGVIKLEAYHSGNHVFIEIADDGKGINQQAVLNKALDKGIIAEHQIDSMTDREIYELLLSSGFSTAETVSDVSGRGVGLDVVKNTIESLGGQLSIDSMQGEGTTFSIQLPLTLSIISVMLVEIEKEKYAIPLSSIIETNIIHKSDLLSARNKQVIDFRGHIVPLVFLKDLFAVPKEDDKESDDYSVVIVKRADKMAALVVDNFIGQQEVVLKSLGNYLTQVFAISGATILGNGHVALIIDSNVLIK